MRANAGYRQPLDSGFLSGQRFASRDWTKVWTVELSQPGPGGPGVSGFWLMGPLDLVDRRPLWIGAGLGDVSRFPRVKVRIMEDMRRLQRFDQGRNRDGAEFADL